MIIVAVWCLAADKDPARGWSRSWSHLSWESDQIGPHTIAIPPNYPPIPFDRYLTWRNYDGFKGEREAVFIWQGKEVGKGLEGFKAVLAEFKALPPSTRVLVYPFLPGDYYIYHMGARHFPFDRNELEWAAVREKIILVYSYRDHEGKLSPEIESSLEELRGIDEHHAYMNVPYRKEPNKVR